MVLQEQWSGNVRELHGYLSLCSLAKKIKRQGQANLAHVLSSQSW
jgi:transcriptional regulator with GAF, ATPase, and Fis domain